MGRFATPPGSSFNEKMLLPDWFEMLPGLGTEYGTHDRAGAHVFENTDRAKQFGAANFQTVQG